MIDGPGSVHNMQHDPGSDPLSLLLPMLRARTLGSPIASVVNETTINLTCKLLSRDLKDYANIAEHIINDSDVEILLDFMLHLLCERRLSNPTSAMNINLRARRLMLKVTTRTPAIPRSLIVTEVSIKSEHSLIGSGGFGRVFKGELGGAPVALKALYKTHNNIDFRREALMWRSLNHDHVLPFLGIYEDDSASYLVSPYMKNGTLTQWRKKENPSITEIGDRMLEVARGMEYIHSEGVVHGDLRGDNILLDADLHVKIADFGLTRLSDATLTRSGALHPNFAAPELLGCSQDDGTFDDVPARTQKSDVYAFGCLYYEIHYDSMPFASKQGVQILRFASLGMLPPRRDEPPLSDEAWNLIQSCWMREASKRPAMKDIPERMMTILNPIPTLLSILKDKEPGASIISVVNTTTVNLIRKLLSREDFVNLVAQLSNSSDFNDLMDFVLFLLHNDDWSNSYGPLDDNGQARQLMLNIIAKTCVMPRSLFLTGVQVKTVRDYISGSLGLVFQGELQGRVVALKVLYEAKGHGNIMFPEALMWRSLNHKFILPFLGIYENEAISKLFLVTSYMENGTLVQWRTKKKPPIAEIEQRILEVAQGVAYIHSEGVVHGDIRGANILLDAHLHVQIAGFGLARVSEDPDNPSGAAHFAAPELFGFLDDAQQTVKTYKSDVYAFGCLYYEIYYNTAPFAAKHDVQVMWLLSRGERAPRLDKPRLNDWAWQLIQSCWAQDALERPAMKDVVERMMTILDPFPIFLSWIKDKKLGSPIASVVNTTSVNLIHKFLSRKDYINISTEISDTSVIPDLVDFMLYLICRGDLSNSLHTNSRARRLMLNIIARTHVTPRSLLVTGVEVITDQDPIYVGFAFKAKLHGKLVALKALHGPYNNTDFYREALMWRSLNHRFLLPFSGIYEDVSASKFFLVSPYMENGTLAQWRKNTNPSIAEIERLILEVAQGITYIHSEGVVHGDICGANIFLDADLHVQIAGFGLARVSDDLDNLPGAAHFAVPELFGFPEDAQQMGKTYKSDVYAFGSLYYEIYYDTVPFVAKHDVQVTQLVKERPWLDKPRLSDWAWELIQSCWAQDALNRPAMKDVVKRMMTILDSCPVFLSWLKDKKPGSPIASVINATTVKFIHKFLSRDDYINIAAELSDTSVIPDLVDFMLYLLCHGGLSKSLHANRRARRLMLNIIAKAPVLPRSLLVMGVGVITDRDLIDVGRFGLVFKAELHGKLVALKVLHRAYNNTDVYREALMWRSLNHKYLLPFSGIYEDESASQLSLVSPFMKNGTLAQWRKNSNPSIVEIERLMLEVAHGITYIHSEGAVHGDICGANVLLDDEFHANICDFGLTRVSGSPDTHTGAFHYNFAAPELFGFSEKDMSDSDLNTHRMVKMYKADVYAFGCLYYEIIYDVEPFASMDPLQMIWLVSRGKRPPRLDVPPLSDWAWMLIQSCWIHETWRRPAMKDVVERMMAPTRETRNLVLDSVLSFLRHKEPRSPITSVVNTTSIDLLHTLLTRKNYIDAAEQLNDPSDIMNILEAIIFVLRKRCFSNPDPNVDTNQRARRLMSKIISRSRLMPRSLFITDLTMPGDRNLLGGGKFGLVFSEHEGKTVALKVLRRIRNNVDFCRQALTSRTFFIPAFHLSESRLCTARKCSGS